MHRLIAVLLFLPVLAPAAHAQGVRAGDLHITGAWARASVVQNGAAYLTVENRGATADRLVAVETAVAASPQIHEHKMEGGVMRMGRVEGGVEIPPGEIVTLRPGGYHLMLIGLKRRLVEGESFEVTLRFERAGAVGLTVPVLAAGSQGPGGKQQMEHEDDRNAE